MVRAKTVDDYIRGSDTWQAELRALRTILNSTGLTEEIKWGAPCYTFAGKNVVGMAAFKSYVGLWFHQGALLQDELKVLINAQEGKTRALRQWRMHSLKDVKAAAIKRYVGEAIRLVREGKAVKPAAKRALVIPAALQQALAGDDTANRKFAELTPGRQRDYAEYIASAKREDTRKRRLKKILPMIRAGTGLNDRYR